MSQSTLKSSRKSENRHKLSTFPRAAHHGKHTELQGFPNTRGKEPAPKLKKSAR